MRSAASGCLIVALLLVVLGATTAGTVAAQSSLDPFDDSAPEVGTAVEIQLEEDGDAVWEVETRVRLADENETRAFDRVGEGFVQGEYDGRTENTFRQLAAAGAEHTGRSMSIQNVSRSWRIETEPPNESGPVPVPPVVPDEDAATGVLRLQFEWVGFTRVEGDEVHLGDVFAANGGWLSGLERDQLLVVRAPPQYSVESTAVGHVNGTFYWEGPIRFDEGELEARFASTDPFDLSDFPVVPAAVAVIVLVLGGIAAVVVRRRWPADAGDTAEPERDGERRPPPESGERSRRDTTAGDSETGEPDPFAGVDRELLSDEERVERHLEAAGGRLRQAEIVDRTGWSNAKVSQLLSSMADEGRVEKLRIGRENLISLPDETPFDEDRPPGGDRDATETGANGR